MHFKTEKNSFFIKTFFHTKFGNFGHLEGGQVRLRGYRRPPHVGFCEALEFFALNATFPPAQVMNEMSKLSDHLTNMGPLEQVGCRHCRRTTGKARARAVQS